MTAIGGRGGRADRVVAREHFRPDIQGLRAIAVVTVVVYHANAAWIPGGYVGVDVFFVISGFLISNHLLNRLTTTGRVGFADFYARRVRRILPASFVVIVLTAIASVIFLPPVLRAGAVWDSIWSALYVPNVAFAIKGTDYLAETAPSPFQHFWSLGVEEQFYLFWPVLLMLLWMVGARSRRTLTGLIGGVVAISFVLGIVVTYQSQPWAFFSLPTRAWELALGGLIAALGPALVGKLPSSLRALGGWLGLGAIVASAVLYNSATVYPGVAPLLPVAGAALVIACGQVVSRYSPSWLLGVRPARFLGEISYSLYLVHWPILIIPALALGESLPPLLAAGLVIASVLVAWLLNVVVETPFRSARLSSTPARWSIVAALSTSSLIAVLAVAALPVVARVPTDSGQAIDPTKVVVQYPTFTPYVPSNLSPSLADSAASVPSIYDDGCHIDVPDTAVQDCAYGDLDSDRVIALFGDSHAAQWFSALLTYANAEGYRLQTYTKSSCPSVNVSIYVYGLPYTECDEWRSAVVEHLAETRPALVVLSNMANQPDQPNGGIDPLDWANGLSDVINRIDAPTLVISDTPRMSATPAVCLSANLNTADRCGRQRSEAVDLAWNSIEADAAKEAGAFVLDLNDYLCDSRECGVIIGNTLVYRDAHHLTVEFVDQLEPLVSEAITQALAAS